jgi:hypothetical protein
MLPIVKPYQATATYAGLPTESYSKLIDSIATTFDKNKTAARALDIALSQIKYNEGDKPLAEGIINKYKEAIDGIAKDAAGNTRYDLATQQVDNTMLDFAKNTNLQHIGKQWAAAEEDRKRLLDPDYNIKYIGEPNTKDFRSINPDGTLNYYKPAVETRLKHEDKAKEIISRVSPEIINSVEGLSDQEKQMIGSQGLYKFITTEKKDSDTYKKVWNYIRNVAKSTPELDQYLRFKGEDALDSLLLNEGLLTQYQNQKVNIQQSPTIGTSSSAAGKESVEDSDFIITPENTINSFNGINIEKLPENKEAYDKSNEQTKEYLSSSSIKKVGGLGQPIPFDKNNKVFNSKFYDIVKKARETDPNVPKDDLEAAKYLNKNSQKVEEAYNKAYGNSAMTVQYSKGLNEGSYLEREGQNIAADTKSTYVIGSSLKDKGQTIQQQLDKMGKQFNFKEVASVNYAGMYLDSEQESKNVSHYNGGLKYVLKDREGNSIEVVKHNPITNKAFEGYNQVMHDLKVIGSTPEQRELLAKGNTLKGKIIRRLGSITTLDDEGNSVSKTVKATPIKSLVTNPDGSKEFITAMRITIGNDFIDKSIEDFQKYMGNIYTNDNFIKSNLKK